MVEHDLSSPVVVVVDTTAIQGYVYGSNRLRENIGASYLVRCATNLDGNSFAFAALPTPHNVADDRSGLLIADRTLDDGLACEVVYAGGGNVVLLARDTATATLFIGALSRRLLTDAPGLQVAIGSHQMKPGENYATAVEAAFDDVNCRKRRFRPSAELLGLGITALCRSTRLPATHMAKRLGNDPPAPVSSDTNAKLQAVDVAQDAFAKRLPLSSGFAYPRELDDLGGSYGESRYIAVVHVDGNGIGKQVEEIHKRHAQQPGRRYIEEMRDFSAKLEAAATAAMDAVLTRLYAVVCDNQRGDRCITYAVGTTQIAKMYLARCGNNSDAGHYLPLRPLILSGDDLTFVCDGRLGLGLAVAYLEEFERATKAALDSPLTACAGIAIVKMAYPFARAYDLAETLSASAKKLRRSLPDDDQGSCLDWHIATSGLSGDLDDIRTTEYRSVQGGQHLVLHQRPVTLGPNPDNAESAWPVVEQAVDGFFGPEWIGRRNKLKALRDTLRQGPGEVERFRAIFHERQPLPELAVNEGSVTETGFMLNRRAAYFDAIELTDFYIPIPPLHR